MKDSALGYKAACEIDLVSAAKSGEHGAFVELCRRSGTFLKRRIQRMVRNREDTEDVLQETLLRAYKHLTGFRAQCGFQSWITAIATNNALMFLRKRRNHRETQIGLITADGKEFETLEVSDPSHNPEQLYANRQANRTVADALKMLSPASRILVEHYHQDEVRLVDAASAIGITEAAAKSRLLRARHALRRHLKNDRELYLD